MKIYKAAWVLVVVLLAGCAGNPSNITQAGANNMAFFSNAAQLTPVASRPGLSRYVDPAIAADSKAIHSLYIAPIEVWLDPSSKYKEVTDADIAELTQQVREAFQKSSGHTYQVVDSPAADSLVVRIVLTDVQLSKSRTRLLDFTPVGLVMKGIKSAAGISRITAESFGIDAEGKGPAGKALFSVRMEPSAVATNPDGSKADTSRLDQLPDRLVALAKNLRTTLTANP